MEEDLVRHEHVSRTTRPEDNVLDQLGTSGYIYMYSEDRTISKRCSTYMHLLLLTASSCCHCQS